MNYKDEFNVRAIGVIPECNWGGLEVLEIDYSEEKIVSCWNYGIGRFDVRKTKLHYTRNGRVYFTRFGKKYYLDEVIRV